MVDPVMKSWDAGPFLTIVTEAGGTVHHARGRPTIHGVGDLDQRAPARRGAQGAAVGGRAGLAAPPPSKCKTAGRTLPPPGRSIACRAFRYFFRRCSASCTSGRPTFPGPAARHRAGPARPRSWRSASSDSGAWKGCHTWMTGKVARTSASRASRGPRTAARSADARC